jgi:hypothetical protein
MGSPNFMRLSLKKGAHAVLSGGRVQEIRGISCRFSRDMGYHEPERSLPIEWKTYRFNGVESHISRKTSEIWGTHALLQG